MKNIYTYFLGIILSLIGSQAYAQLSPYDLNKPVGFGEKVTGGEGGRNITVTTRSELSNALKTTDKAIIYIKGAIEVNSMLKVVAKNKTILGLPVPTFIIITVRNPAPEYSISVKGLTMLLFVM